MVEDIKFENIRYWLGDRSASIGGDREEAIEDVRRLEESYDSDYIEDKVDLSEYFRIVGDGDGHDYVIPADKGDEWYDWVDRATDFWRRGRYKNEEEPIPEVPEWAEGAGGNIIFKKWRVW